MPESVKLSAIDTKTFKYNHYRLLNFLFHKYLEANPRNFNPAIINKNIGPYEVNLSELFEYLGLKENKQIVDLFQKLSKSYIEFSDEEDNNLGFCSILASEVFIKEDSLCFNFTDFIKKLIDTGKIKEHLRFNGTLMFKNKFAKDLYYIARETSEEETEWIDVDDFRDLLAVPDKKMYKNFKNVGSKIISPSILEINTLSDLNLVVEYITDDKGIKSVRFKISKDDPVIHSSVVAWLKPEMNKNSSEGSDDKETDNTDPLYKAKLFINGVDEATLENYRASFLEIIKNKKMVYQRFQKYGYNDVLIENVFLQYIRDNILKKAS